MNSLPFLSILCYATTRSVGIILCLQARKEGHGSTNGRIEYCEHMTSQPGSGTLLGVAWIVLFDSPSLSSFEPTMCFYPSIYISCPCPSNPQLLYPTATTTPLCLSSLCITRTNTLTTHIQGLLHDQPVIISILLGSPLSVDPWTPYT